MFLSFRLVYLSFCIYNRKTHMKTETNIKCFEKNNNRKHTNTFSSRNLRNIYSRSGRGLDILYFCLFYVFLEAVLFVFLFVFFVMLSPSLFKFCIYNRNTTHIKTKQNITCFDKNKQNTKKNRNTLLSSRNLRNIYSRSGRGLDILYLCFCLNVFLVKKGTR